MTVQLDEPRPTLSIVPTKLILGVFLTLVGILLTADNFDYVDAGAYLRWWPAVLILLGLLKLRQPGGRGVAIFLLAAGGWILAFNLGLVTFTIFDLWPLILIAIGVGFVRKALRGDSADVPGAGATARAENGMGGLAILSQRRIRPGAGYAGGRVGAFLGNCQLDLTEASLAQNPTIVEAIAFLGGVEILVPEGWEVVGEVFPVMGGFDMKTGPAAEPKRQLVVRGMAFMGGVEVKNSGRSGR